MFFKKRFPILLGLSLLLAGSLLAFTPKIFYVNLYDKDADVRLGTEDNYIFLMDGGLGPDKATYMVNASTTGSYGLYFKVHSKDDWTLWTDDDDKPYNCDVVDDKDNCIVTGTDGHVEFFTMKEPEGEGAKVCFFNGKAKELSRMEIGPSWGESTKAYIDGISPNVVSSFVTIKPGDYSLFWQTPDQKKKDKHFFYADSSGDNPEKFSFESGEYYLFLAYTADESDYGTLYTITPQVKKDKSKKKGGSKLDD